MGAVQAQFFKDRALVAYFTNPLALGFDVVYELGMMCKNMESLELQKNGKMKFAALCSAR